MDSLEQLSRRVQQAVDEILSLKKERGHLLTEIEQLKEQLRGHKLAARETDIFEREKARIRSKLEKLQAKITKLITAEPEAPAAVAVASVVTTVDVPVTPTPAKAKAKPEPMIEKSVFGELFDEKHS